MTMGEVRGKSEVQKAKGPSVLLLLPMAAYMPKMSRRVTGRVNCVVSS